MQSVTLGIKDDAGSMKMHAIANCYFDFSFTFPPFGDAVAQEIKDESTSAASSSIQGTSFTDAKTPISPHPSFPLI